MATKQTKSKSTLSELKYYRLVGRKGKLGGQLTVGAGPKGGRSWVSLHFAVENNISTENSMDVLWLAYPFGRYYRESKQKLGSFLFWKLSNQTGLLTVNSKLSGMGGRASRVDGFASIVSAMLEL